MKSKMSFFNKGIVFDDIRRFGWISIAYTLILFFLVPLKILMITSSEQAYGSGQTYREIIKKIFYYINTAQGLFVAIVPVLLGIFLFRYMQEKNSSDMIHSLPIRRSVLYRSHVAFGIVSLLIPVIVIGSISIVLNKTLDLGQYYRIYDVIQWIGITLLFDMLFFLSSVFLGMVVGSSVMQGVLTYIFLFLPLGLTILLTENLKIFIYGFTYNFNHGISKLSPVARILEGFGNFDISNSNQITSMEIIIYLLICIILYFAAKPVYNKRRIEAASQTIAFRSLQYIFKYGVAFCSMLLAGAYFYATQGNINWILFGFFIGSVIGYFVAEMIIKKSIWVFKNIRGYGIYAIIMIVLMMGIKLDITGYENKLPALDNVNSIYFSGGFYDSYLERYNMDVYSDRNNLKRIQDFHKKLIEDKGTNKKLSKDRQRSVVFEYRLRDGSKIKRGYNIAYADYNKYFKPIYESKEHKNMKYDVFSLNSSDVEKITFHPVFNMSKGGSVILKPEDIKEAIEVLKEDINKETYEQMDDRKSPWAELSFMIANDKLKKYPKLTDNKYRGDDKQAHVSWRKSYILFEEWLKKKGYLENSRVLPKDIGYIVVEEVKNNQQLQEKLKTGRLIDEDKIGGGKVKRLEISDKDKIETCLRNYSNPGADNNAKYVIGFYSADKRSLDFGSFDENNAPDFVRSYFQK